MVFLMFTFRKKLYDYTKLINEVSMYIIIVGFPLGSDL